jgi:hypothetical protein
MQAATQPITRKTTTNRDQNVSPSNVLPNTQNSVNTKVNSGNVAPMTPIPQQPKIDYKLQDMDAKLSQLKSNVFSLSNIPA